VPIDRAHAQRLRWLAQARDRDPIAHWHHASEESREATRLLSQAEVLARWPNWTGKTSWGAASVVAMLQGRPTLDGEPLPIVRKPAAAILSLDYEQQRFSVQPAIMAAVGDWPHHVTKKGDDILGTLRVKPLGGGDDYHKWPVATFVSQENRKAGTGARVPIVWGDEPPNESIWREFRKSARAGERSIRLITMTPLLRRLWWWVREDFKGCDRVVNNGRVEVHMTDVRHCRLVTPAKYAELLNLYRGDPFIKARLTAEYCDVENASPWADLIDVLSEMLEQAVEPTVETWRITREVDGEKGRTKEIEAVEVEVWEHPVAGEPYYIPIDGSEGIDDGRHDPGALHVRKRHGGELVARYNGYIGSYGLGVLAAGLARQYGMALVDPETQGGYGGPCLTALSDCGYGNINKQKRPDQHGKLEVSLGFKTTDQTRPEMFSSISEWLKSWRAGVRYARCPSRAVLQSLIDLILDDRGRPVAAPGLHDEDPILWGQGCRVLCRPRQASVGPTPVPQVPQTIAEMLKRRGPMQSPRTVVRPRGRV
jgi:hypothetical protein